MNTVKILHCADIHIGATASFLGERAEGRRRETLLTFEKIVDLCIQNAVQVLLIAGDLFDSNTVENSLTEPVLAKIKSVPQLKVVFSAGNHDPYNPRSPFAGKKLSNLFILKNEETVLHFPELSLKVYGRSFETAFLQGKPYMQTAPDPNTINICLQHGELFGDPESRYNTISREFISHSGMDYIALGHVHKKTEIEKLGDTFFAYSGCPEGQGFDELGEKGVYIGEVGKGICNLEFVPTAKRQHIFEKIDIGNSSDNIFDLILQTLENKYGDAYSQSLYKIHLIGLVAEDFKIDTADITARLSERLYFVKLENKTDAVIDLEALAAEQSLKGIFTKKMLAKISSAHKTERPILENALKLGLKAFTGEVKFDEN